MTHQWSFGTRKNSSYFNMTMKTNRGVKEEDEDRYECYAQWGLVVINFVVLSIGVVLIVLGSLTLWERGLLEGLQLGGGGLYVGLSSVIVLAGCFLLVLSVFGCVAGFKENKWCLLVYYFSVVFVFFLLCIIVLLGYVFRMKVTHDWQLRVYNAVSILASKTHVQ